MVTAMRILRMTLVTLMLGPLAACLVTAQGGTGHPMPPPGGGPPPPSMGVVEGVIVDAQTHQGLSKTALDFMRDKRAVATFTTDPSGHYVTGELPPGEYQVRVRREQYTQVVNEHLEVQPGHNEWNPAMQHR